MLACTSRFSNTACPHRVSSACKPPSGCRHAGKACFPQSRCPVFSCPCRPPIRALDLTSARLSSCKAAAQDCVGKTPQNGSTFEGMLHQLVAWKGRYGSCYVPKQVFDARELALWVWQIRAARKKGQLSSEQIQQLEAVGFIWKPTVVGMI